MKNIIFAFLTVFISSYSLADGAFGTYKGMTKEDLESKGIKFETVWDGSSLSSKDAPIKNKSFESYYYYFDKDNKLCSIKAVTEMQHNKAANNLADFFNIKINYLTTLLSEKYGNPRIINNTHTEESNSKWIDALAKIKMNDTPRYVIVWNSKLNSLRNDIEFIVLRPVVIVPQNNRYSGLLIIEYFYKDCIYIKHEKRQFEENSKGL